MLNYPTYDNSNHNYKSHLNECYTYIPVFDLLPFINVPGKFIKNNFLVNDVLEKPSIRSAPSNYVVIGRYILPAQIFKILKKQKPGINGEIHITDAIKTLIQKKNNFIGHVFAGKYLDCGTMSGYINSTRKILKL